jgi:hypothetical protein
MQSFEEFEVGHTNFFIKRDNNFFNNGLIKLLNTYMNLHMVISNTQSLDEFPVKMYEQLSTQTFSRNILIEKGQ